MDSRPLRSGLLLAAVAILLSNGTCRAQSLSRDEYKVEQCGFSASCLVLSLFGRRYEPRQLSQQLAGDVHGISADRIRDVLCGYGLRVDSRYDCKPKEVIRYLRAHPDQLAILALGVGKHRQLHYVVALAKANEVVIADPPHRVFPVESLVERRFYSGGGLVLFVSAAPNSLASSVDISPASIELGDLGNVEGGDTSDKPQMRRKLSLRNLSTDSPVVISSIRASCTCIQPNWQRGWLNPSEERTIEVSIDRDSLVPGEFVYRVAVQFADQSVLSIPLTGSTAKIRRGWMRIHPSELNIELTDKLQQSAFCQDFWIECPDGHHELRTSSVPDAVRVEVEEAGPKKLKGSVFVDIEAVEFEKLVDGHLGQVIFSSAHATEVLPIRLFKRYPRPTESYLELASSCQSASVTIEGIAEQPSTPELQILRIDISPKGLDVVPIEGLAKNVGTLRIQRSPKTEEGLYAISVKVAQGTKVWEVAIFASVQE